jgi:myo-inositol-1(or 4)-monophosphatase
MKNFGMANDERRMSNEGCRFAPSIKKIEYHNSSFDIRQSKFDIQWRVSMDLAPHLEVAVSAAKKAADILQSRFGKISRIRKKAAEEIVTEADIESEKEIITLIRSAFPEHGILSEERGMINAASEYRWIIDPLDGTVNFAHGVPIFCISIALALNGEVVLGVVFNPVSGELFSAVIGQRARLNHRPIQVSSVAPISESLLVTGFPYNVDQVFNQVHTRYGNCLRAAQGLRRLGSAALDLCYVACGRVTTFSNQPFTVDQPEILATNGRVHGEMIELLKINE